MNDKEKIKVNDLLPDHEFENGEVVITTNGRTHIKDSAQMDMGRCLLQETKAGNIQKVKRLVGLGAPFTADWVGTSPLHFAAFNNHVGICAILLRAGIAQDARNKVDRTPLHVACQLGHAEIVKVLLAFHADVKAKDMLWMTPLHWAAESGNSDVVKLVLNHGSPVHLVDKFGKSAIDIAEEKMNYVIVKLIQDAKEMPANKRVEIITTWKNQSEILAKKIKWNDDLKEVGQDGTIQVLTRKKEYGVILDRELNTSNGIERVLVTSAIEENPKIKDEPESESDDFNYKTLQLFKEHGISLLEPDTGTVVSSAVESGQSVKLTEAGKLALISSKPGKTVVITKPKEVIQAPTKVVTKSNKVPLNILTSGKKVIQVNANELIKMTTQKKFIIKQANGPNQTTSPIHVPRFFEGKVYTNLEHYIDVVKIKKRECESNVEELRKLLNTKRNEISRLNFLLYSAVKEKSGGK